MSAMRVSSRSGWWFSRRDGSDDVPADATVEMNALVSPFVIEFAQSSLNSGDGTAVFNPPSQGASFRLGSTMLPIRTNHKCLCEGEGVRSQGWSHDGVARSQLHAHTHTHTSLQIVMSAPVSQQPSPCASASSQSSDDLSQAPSTALPRRYTLRAKRRNSRPSDQTAKSAKHETSAKSVQVDSTKSAEHETFTNLVRMDSVTLPLVFGFLDVRSKTSAGRVCRVWCHANVNPLAWVGSRVTMNMVRWIRFLAKEDGGGFPPGILKSLRNIHAITLVNDLHETSTADLSMAFEGLRRLPRLHELRLEEFTLVAEIWPLLVSLPALKDLDLKMTYFPELPQQHKHHHLKHLRSLKLPFAPSERHVIDLLASLEQPETLQLRMGSEARRENELLGFLNQRFTEPWARSLRHLSLARFHAADQLRFDLLHELTHLSLTTPANSPHAVPIDSLLAIAQLSKLQSVEIRMVAAAVRACTHPAWWQALCQIRALTGFGIWEATYGTAYGPMFTEEEDQHILDGLRMLLSASNCRVESLCLGIGPLVDDDVLQAVSGASSIRSLTLFEARSISVRGLEALRQLPRLTELEAVACPFFYTTEGLEALVRCLPNLHSFSFRVPSRRSMRAPKPEYDIRVGAWVRLLAMPRLTFLHLSGVGLVSEEAIRGWCKRARYCTQAQKRHDDRVTRAKWSGSKDDRPSSRVRLSSTTPPSVPWQELRVSKWGMSMENAKALLKSMPQLQVLSMHMLSGTEGGAFIPPLAASSRLLACGGDYTQRLIAPYATSAQHVFH
jgi:hypothetical protein